MYLSNAVERFCRAQGIALEGRLRTWASYGFSPEGKLILEEYYPYALRETYAGVGGYLYAVADAPQAAPLPDIPFAFGSPQAVRVTGSTPVPDALAALLAAEKRGKIKIRRFCTQSAEKRRWIAQTVRAELHAYGEETQYAAFLLAKFPFLRTAEENPGRQARKDEEAFS